jgi:hypothetical protein
MITKLELQDWKSHPVTEAYFEAIDEMEGAVVEQLIKNVNQEMHPDDWYRGYIYALRDMLNVDLAEED